MICCLFFCNKIPRGILSRVHASWSFLINKYRLSSDESTGLPWLLCPVVCLLPGISRSLMWCLCWSPCTTSVPMCLSVDSRWCSLPWNLQATAEHAQFSQLVFKPQAGLKTAKMIAEKKKSCYFPALYSVFTLQFICHKGVQVSGNTKHKPIATSVCLCSSHANIICHSSQVASWSLL